MVRIFYPVLIGLAFILGGCPKKELIDKTALNLYGIWVKEGDVPESQPTDTLLFFSKNDKNMLAFYSGLKKVVSL